MHVGHAQINPFGPLLEITNMSMTPIGNRQVLVEYDVEGPTNSITKITVTSPGPIIPVGGLGLVYEQVINKSIIGDITHISATITVHEKYNNEVLLVCEICTEDNTDCQRDGCVVIVSDE